jgi:hypothetical protein
MTSVDAQLDQRRAGDLPHRVDSRYRRLTVAIDLG